MCAVSKGSKCLCFFGTATLATVERHQAALFHIELTFFNNGPFVKIMTAEGFAFGFLFRIRAFERQDIVIHAMDGYLSIG